MDHSKQPQTEGPSESIVLPQTTASQADVLLSETFGKLSEACLHWPKNAEKLLVESQLALVSGLQCKNGCEPESPWQNLVLSAIYVANCFLPRYSTLNYSHLSDIHSACRSVAAYLDDKSLTRPHNYLLLAPPGAGKSRLVESLADYAGGSRVRFEKFNMATMRDNDDLLGILDAARNAVVDNKLPIIFLDEFDANDFNYSLLLPLLWDGALDVGRRKLRIGKSVIFLAGSRRSLPTKLAEARDMFSMRRQEHEDSKLVDLMSRIGGTVIEIPRLSDGENGLSADKVVIAVNLIRRRFEFCKLVPRRLLWFIAHSHFRYQARSIEMLVNLIGSNDHRIDVNQLSITEDQLNSLPLNDESQLRQSPLAFHLMHKDGEFGLIELWRRSQKSAPGNQLIASEALKIFNQQDDIPNLISYVQSTFTSDPRSDRVRCSLADGTS